MGRIAARVSPLCNQGMAERRAQNKYYPPDWDPSKGSLNTFHGQHALRDRAKRLGEGILVVRFEMPFNIWCQGCEAHIGRGVRFNADKKKDGEYYSTPIWSFSMKCPRCSNPIVIHTDPKHCTYKVTLGARRQQNIDHDSHETHKSSLEMKKNPFFLLENRTVDQKNKEEAKVTLSSIEETSRRVWLDDHASSRMLRRRFRAQKTAFGKNIEELERRKLETLRNKLADPVSTSFLQERPEDVTLASNSVRNSATFKGMRISKR